MSIEKEALVFLVGKLVDNGAFDDIVTSVLETQLKIVFEELERLSKEEYLKPHQFQDYAENLSFAGAAVRVLRYFTTYEYEEEMETVEKYSLKLQEL